MTAIELTCEQCLALPYELCKLENGRPAPFTHAKRIEDAAACGSNEVNDPEIQKEAIDAAVNELI